MILHEEKKCITDFVRTPLQNGGFQLNKKTRVEVQWLDYEIEEGDTLSSISQRFLGDGSMEYVGKIYRGNITAIVREAKKRFTEANPNIMYPGTVLRINRGWRA